MKKTNIYITVGLMVLITITSCKKLTLNPYNAIAVQVAFQTVKDANTWDNGMYALFKGKQYGSYMFYADVQADQLNAALDFGNNDGPPHRWDFTADDQTLGPMWLGYYNAIANANTAIAGFPNIQISAATDIASMNQYTGDEYLARAYYYHRLVKRWAKPYESATAATDLGVPLVLTFDISALPARATVQAVYNQIIADITTAKTLLANVQGAQGSKTFTLDCALALEARVRLDMHDYAGAYAAANSLIAGGKYPLITTQAGLNAYWATDGIQESIMQMAATTTELPNTNNIYLGYSGGTGKYDPFFIPSQWVYNMFPTGDLRKATYFASLPCLINGIPYSNLILVNKYPGNPALFTAATTNYAQAPKVFRIAEMYLIAAEAAASAGNSANALTALNALRAARSVAASTGGANLVQDVRDERFRELAFEGFRLEDLERWHLGFTRTAPQNVNALATGPGYYTLSIAADAQKFVWGIPTNDIIINTNLVQNPGW